MRERGSDAGGSLRDRLLRGLGKDHPLLWLVLALVFAGFAWFDTGWLRYANIVLMGLCLAFGALAFRRRRE